MRYVLTPSLVNILLLALTCFNQCFPPFPILKRFLLLIGVQVVRRYSPVVGIEYSIYGWIDGWRRKRCMKWRLIWFFHNMMNLAALDFCLQLIVHHMCNLKSCALSYDVMKDRGWFVHYAFIKCFSLLSCNDCIIWI